LPKKLRRLVQNQKQEIANAKQQATVAKAELQVAEAKAEQHVTVAKAELQVAEAKAEQHVTVAKAELQVAEAKAVAEREMLLRQLASATTAFQVAQSKLNCVTPRAVLEYVENWVMPEKAKGQNRLERWKAFFDSEEGKQLCDCIAEENKMWLIYAPTNANAKWTKSYVIAERINILFKQLGDMVHEGAHNINATKSFVLTRLDINAQAFNVAACIASHFDLEIRSSNTTGVANDEEEIDGEDEEEATGASA